MERKDSWTLPPDERSAIQDNRWREMLIRYYAPREPMVMGNVLRFLEVEKKYPLHLVHRIMDRLASISISTTVMAHEEIVAFIQCLPDDFAIARGPCACRIHTQELGPDARDLPGGDLGFCRKTPMDVDIQIATCGVHFGNLPTYEVITRQELLALEETCHGMGLVPNVYTMFSGEAGICHCSAQTCIPFMANEAIGGRSSVIRPGSLVSRTDPSRCTGHGACVEVCHFHARSVETSDDGRARVHIDPARCYGCGYCAEVCPEGAITMKARSAG